MHVTPFSLSPTPSPPRCRHGLRLSYPPVNIDSTMSACFTAYSPTAEVLTLLQRWPTSSKIPSPRLQDGRGPIKTSPNMAISPLRPRAELFCKPWQPLTQLGISQHLANGTGIPATKVSLAVSCPSRPTSACVLPRLSTQRVRKEYLGLGERDHSCAGRPNDRRYKFGVARCLVQLEFDHRDSLIASVSYSTGRDIVEKSVFVILGSFHSSNTTFFQLYADFLSPNKMGGSSRACSSIM